MRSSRSTECYLHQPIRPVGLAGSRLAVTDFQIDFAVFLPTPAPGHFRFRVHPLVSLLPLQSSTRWNLHAAFAPCAFLEVSPSFATSTR